MMPSYEPKFNGTPRPVAFANAPTHSIMTTQRKLLSVKELDESDQIHERPWHTA